MAPGGGRADQGGRPVAAARSVVAPSTGSGASRRVLTPRRAACSAVAAATVVVPAPPVPAKSSRRTDLILVYPSTRFFSSFRAVSMIVFSALRRSMPSIGILTSTLSVYVTSVPAASVRSR